LSDVVNGIVRRSIACLASIMAMTGEVLARGGVNVVRIE
jgi:hypothetical protein